MSSSNSKMSSKKSTKRSMFSYSKQAGETVDSLKTRMCANRKTTSDEPNHLACFIYCQKGHREKGTRGGVLRT